MVLHSGDDRPVALGFGTLGVPFGIGLERGPFLFTVGERFPFQEIIESLVRISDGDCPKAGLLDAVPLPDIQSNRVKALQQIRQAARHTVVDAQFVKHGVSLLTSPMKSRSAAESYC